MIDIARTAQEFGWKRKLAGSLGAGTEAAFARGQRCPRRQSRKRNLVNLILVLVFGLVVGAAAQWLAPGKERSGWMTSLGLGVLGSVVGDTIGRFMGVSGEGRSLGFLMSVVGAVLLLLGYRLIARRPAST